MNKKNILVVCTSNKDRSPAIVEYFNINYKKTPFNFFSAGVNKYFCTKYNRHYLTIDDLRKSDWIVCAEEIHKTVIMRDFALEYKRERGFKLELKNFLVLNCGEYVREGSGANDDYLLKAEHRIIETIEDLA